MKQQDTPHLPGLDLYDRARFDHYIEVDKEKHTPPPAGRAGAPPKIHMPLKTMDVGESFTAPRSLRSTIYLATSYLSRFTDKHFVCETLSHRTIRVHRIK